MEVVGGGVVAAMHNGCGFSKAKTIMELRWAKTRGGLTKTKSRNIPLFVSTNPSDVNPHELLELFSECSYSCHRIPIVGSAMTGSVASGTVELNKLRVALAHSTVVVSVFCNSPDLCNENEQIESIGGASSDDGQPSWMGLGDLLQRTIAMPSPSNGELVGFGRAVSDLGLTASIYDVMVLPALQRMGIGKMIVKRILRMLTSKDIYDISALCSPDKRLFFEACGFGDDMLGSTTMMYTGARSPRSKRPD